MKRIIGYSLGRLKTKIIGGEFDQNFTSKIDAREYAPKDKHPTILKTFENLKPGEKMELINDHDPRPLHYQFMAELKNRFEWDYLEEGPEVWRVSITKKAVH